MRLILLFRRDVPIVCELIESALEICSRHDRADKLSFETFGYQSIHYIVRPPKSWLSVPTFSAVGIFQAEVQVRTLAQHMWAAASHVFQYKQEESVPPPMRRTIHRVSALLEIVDLEFERVLDEREEYRKNVRLERKSRHLNADVLAATLDELLPSENKGALELYSLLLWELGKLGIDTSGQLSGIIEKHLPSALDDERDYLEHHGRSDSSNHPQRKGIFTHLGLVRLILQKEFGVNFFDGRIWEELDKEDVTFSDGTAKDDV